MNSRPILIKEHKNHIRDHQFITDGISTIYGVPIEEMEDYCNFYTEFEADDSLDPFIVSIPYYTYHKIERGTLKVYGYKKGYDFQI